MLADDADIRLVPPQDAGGEIVIHEQVQGIDVGGDVRHHVVGGPPAGFIKKQHRLHGVYCI